jgi:hypothetical protein
MRVLFVLQYPGYLRYFDSVMRLLLDRGHTVALAYDKPHKQAEGNEALAGLAVEMLPEVPVERGVFWSVVGLGVRGTIDYVRYLDPRFADSPYLRDRMRIALPSIASGLGKYDTLGTWKTNLLLSILHVLERAIPSSPTIEGFLEGAKPDLVVVSPLVTDASTQVDIFKSAQALGIPAALCVASWDHLTTKGLMRITPDLVTVWNEHQRDEAAAYHRIERERVVVTGAPPFDRWFGRTPSRDREAFCRLVGLPSDRPFILFVGSTKSISRPDAETVFVRQWVTKLRAELDKRKLKVSILIRPHPFNSSHWAQADLGGLENAAIFPRHEANPVNEADRADYFDSLFHSEAVVGINTSAMIEAAIVGRTVHTLLDPLFSGTQEGTLHFRYLLPENGGFLRVAHSMDEHVQQLADTLDHPSAGAAQLDAFVRAFVRPHGLTTAATPLQADALEGLAKRGRTRPRHVPIALYPVSAVLFLAGLVSTYRRPGSTQKAARNARKRWRNTRRRAVGKLRVLLGRPTDPDPS